MEHDMNHSLTLEIGSMANLAERCSSNSIALYYREQEFIYNQEDSIESLISLYSMLEQPEAAEGMLNFVNKTRNNKFGNQYSQNKNKEVNFKV